MNYGIANEIGKLWANSGVINPTGGRRLRMIKLPFKVVKAVTSTFQDLDFDVCIITTLYQLMLQSLVNTLVLFS